MRSESVPPVRKDAEEIIAEARSHLARLHARTTSEQAGIGKAIQRAQACIGDSREIIRRIDVELGRFENLLRGGSLDP